MIKRLLGVMLGVVTLAGPALAQAPTPRGPSAAMEERSTPGTVKELLARWERKCASNHAIETRFTLAKSYPDWDQVERFEASALLARPNKLYVNLVEVAPAGATPRREFHHRIIDTGRTLYLLMNPTRQVVILDSGTTGGEGLIQSDLIALLFDLRVAAVLNRYRVELVKETAHSYVLQFIPRPSPAPPEFRRLDIMLDRNSLLPTALRLVATNGKDTQLFKFTKVVPNPVVKDTAFEPPELKGWKVVDLSLSGLTRARPSGGPLPPPVYSEVSPPPPSGPVAP
jgi:hypothetical protein